uniref:Non-reducing polyketide synthase n=1 Tax=Hypomyces subiculosus TaxID=193393 RepID=B3FWR9_HYPSB|nr:non-reducing polyketide synthase [Hypomyces subiculosus]
MVTVPQTILYFGDQTDSWVDSLDQLYRQAATIPWLQTFLDDLVKVFKEESRGMDHALQDSVGEYSTLLDLADRYRHGTDEIGMVRAVLLHAARGGMLLQWVKKESQLVDLNGSKPEALGISGGLTNLAALAISTDFESLYDAVIEAARIFVRLCRFTSVRSRAMEDRPGVWGWAVLGITPEELSKVLEQFQSSMGIPAIKRAKVGVTGDRWSTVIGPPSVLDLFIHQCPAVRNLPKNELSIHALQHTVTVTEADLDFIVGSAELLSHPIVPDFKVWGMDDPVASYQNWGEMLRAIVTQVLSKPLDITKVIAQLNTHLGPRHVDVRVIGPSSHTPYLASSLKAAGSKAIFQTDKTLEQLQPKKLPPGRIAIVGMAGRGPGCENVDEFWDVIMAKQDRCEEIPKDRFDINEFYCTEHGEGCTTTTKYGCFMNKPGNFDSRFFHVSPREALLMDPGHRQFMMSTYEALETAGYSDGQTRDVDPNRIAAFYGQSNDDWHMVSHYTLGCDAYTLQGAQRAFGAGRIAFHFKWEGPTYSLDSACASTSSAIHLACVSLLSKDVDMAVVGAANVVGYPHSWTSLSKSGVLSDTGNCKTYCDDADGYCRADFVGSVVLKRLEDAVEQNDNILAVVAGSGRNHSGNSSSITTSDAGAQERLFHKIMHSARVSPDEISYVEMHGTGTQIGDPAEMSAVTNVFRKRKANNPLTVGGIKANVGHAEASAGMASLLKCIQMFQKDIMPPQARMPHTLNPKYPSLSELNIHIPSEPKEFKAIGERPRRILLNNFDAAGGNASLILEDFPSTVKENADPRPSHVIVSSAKTQSSYHANKRNLLKWLRKNKDAKLEDVAYTTTARRMHHPLRFSCSASTTEELISKLEADTADATASRGSPVVFVFTGQGSHYAGMGAELYKTCPAFREEVNLCASISEEHGFPPYVDIITNKDVDITTKDTMQTQLAVVTLEIALAAFWKASGIQPSAVMGHSLGEYVALQVAGVLSLADLLYLVGNRARLLLERCEADTCAMLAVSSSAASIRELIDQRPQSSFEIACKNSPNATVISGSTDEISELQSSFTASRARALSVPYGFHSFQMDPMLEDYIVLAGGVTYSPPKIPVASTLLASIVESSGVFNASYLGQQTRQAVDFVGALGALKEKFADPLWLEIGPSQICSSFVRATLSPSPGKILSTLEANTNPWASISKCLAGAYKDGVAVDWLAVHAPFKGGLKLVKLPAYAWDLKDFWIVYSEANKAARALAPAPSFETQRISTCAQQIVEESSSPSLHVSARAAISDPGFMALVDGHRMRDVSICPGSVFCEAGLAVSKYALKYSGRKDTVETRLTINNLSLKRPLTKSLVGTDGELLTTVVADKASSDTLQVSWKASSSHASYDLGSCEITICDAQTLQTSWNRSSYFVKARMNELIKNVKSGNGHRMLPSILYTLFASTVDYDPTFKSVKEAFISNEFDEAAAEVVLQKNPAGTQFFASPYWGESVVHLAGFLVNSNPARKTASQTTFMMQSLESVEQTADLEAGRTYYTYARVLHEEEDTVSCDLFVFDSEKMVMQCSGLSFHEVSNNVLDRLLGKASPPVKQVSHQKAPVLVPAESKPALKAAVEAAPKAPEPVKTEVKKISSSESELFHTILESIAKETGTQVSDFTDDMELAELGVDSIMGIEIAAGVSSRTGLDVLLPSFVVDYPTIGDLRNEFARSSTSTPPSKTFSEFSIVDATPESTRSSSRAPSEKKEPAPASEKSEELVIVPSAVVEDSSPLPSARITLIQGRSSSGKQPFYLIADGAGSIATYIHLAPFKDKRPVYGIDSPFLRCPSRLTTQVGIEGVAKIIFEALIKCQPEGPFDLGGFSGGAMLSYEVSRQLAAAGRVVSSLLLIDMCSPRPLGVEDTIEVGWKVYETIASQDKLWNASSNTQQHLKAVFACVAAYHPPPMTPAQRPKRTAIIWAKKGMVDRCSRDEKVMKFLADKGIPTESYPGFMEDPKLGAVAWGLPHKSAADLGPNGWDKFLGETLCLSIDSDHLDMPMPGHVHLLQAAMEESFKYFSEAN